MKKTNSPSPSGFTLIEVLVAMTLLTTALVPTFVLAGRAVNLSTQIKNSLISTNLAQEGVEVVRALRDGNWFATPPRPFDSGLTTCTAGCRVQWDTTGTTGVLPMSANPPLKLDSVTGRYQYTTGTDTIFRRAITITRISPAELRIVSTVTWAERTGPKSVLVEYHLFDWLP